MDPMNGKVYSIVNQEWALRRGFKPCSTIKLVTGVAGLSENIIPPSELALAYDRPRMDLTAALAHSDNSYLNMLAAVLVLTRWSITRASWPWGKTGLNVPFEYPGRLPEMKLASLSDACFPMQMDLKLRRCNWQSSFCHGK